MKKSVKTIINDARHESRAEHDRLCTILDTITAEIGTERELDYAGVVRAGQKTLTKESTARGFPEWEAAVYGLIAKFHIKIDKKEGDKHEDKV